MKARSQAAKATRVAAEPDNVLAAAGAKADSELLSHTVWPAIDGQDAIDLGTVATLQSLGYVVTRDKNTPTAFVIAWN